MKEPASTVDKTEQDLPTILHPTGVLPELAAVYEGFGQGITNLAAAASIGLRIPLHPLYFCGGIVALIFAYLKLRETQNRVAQRREILLALLQDRQRDHHHEYWTATNLHFFYKQIKQNLPWIMDNISAEKVAERLGFFYQLLIYDINEDIASEEDDRKKRLLERIKNRLTLKILAEANQFNNPELRHRLLKAANLPAPDLPSTTTLSVLKQFWFNLRKYYKSILTGAATAGGLTVIIIESSLSTATLTLLFPWSIAIILGALVIGGITGFILDKYLDRHHKNELERIATETLAEQNKKRLGNLWADFNQTLKELPQHILINIHEPFRSIVNLYPSKIEPLPALPSLNSELEYVEVRALKAQSHIKRKIADFFLSTLIAARVAFGAVSTVFAGLALAGLMLGWWPVVLIGGTMLGIHVLFRFINNAIKHQSEEAKIERLNHIISAEKISYWNFALQREDCEQIVKNSTPEQLLNDLRRQYEQFTAQLKVYQQDQSCAEIMEALGALHLQLLMQYRVHADNLNNKDQLATLQRMALTSPPSSSIAPKIITPHYILWRVAQTFSSIVSGIDAFLVRNLKDIITGFAFGFGSSLTVFAYLGMTSSLLLVGWPLAVVASACLVGIGIRVAIRHGIKAFRNQRLLDIDIHGEKPIKDKEQLLDCQAATAIALEKANQLATDWLEQKKSPIPVGYSRPLLWIESAGTKEAQGQEKNQQSSDGLNTPLIKSPHSPQTF